MSKLKKSTFKHYELLYVITNTYSDNEIDPVKTKVEELITANGGEIKYKESWGTKKLAYRINNNHSGYYELIQFDLKAENLAPIEQKLRLDADLLRSMIVKISAITEPEKKQAEKIAQSQTQVEEIKQLKKEELEKEVISDKKEKQAKKLDLKELDEKLDKILDVDSLL